MFNWECPRCGRENSPAYTECPDCKALDASQVPEGLAQQPAQIPAAQPVYAPEATQAWQQAPPPYIPAYVPAPGPQAAQPLYAPPQPQYAQPPQYAPQQPLYAPQPPQYTQPPQQYAPQQTQYVPPQPAYQPPPQPTPQFEIPSRQQSSPLTQTRTQPVAQPSSQTTQQIPAQQTRQLPPLKAPAARARPTGLAALPVWLLMILFTAAFLAVGAGIYYGYRAYSSGPAGFTGGTPPATTSKAKPSNPLQKYIEVVGVRLTNDAKKKPVAKYLVVNHSDGVMNDLSGTVTLWASTSRSEEDAVGSFMFHLDSLKPNESKDVISPLKTKLKMYELPDWQNLTAEVQITSPQQ